MTTVQEKKQALEAELKLVLKQELEEKEKEFDTICNTMIEKLNSLYPLGTILYYRQWNYCSQQTEFRKIIGAFKIVKERRGGKNPDTYKILCTAALKSVSFSSDTALKLEQRKKISKKEIQDIVKSVEQYCGSNIDIKTNKGLKNFNSYLEKRSKEYTKEEMYDLLNGKGAYTNQTKEDNIFRLLFDKYDIWKGDDPFDSFDEVLMLKKYEQFKKLLASNNRYDPHLKHYESVTRDFEKDLNKNIITTGVIVPEDKWTEVIKNRMKELNYQIPLFEVAKTLNDFPEYEGIKLKELATYSQYGTYRGISVDVVGRTGNSDYEPYTTHYILGNIDVDWKHILYPIKDYMTSVLSCAEELEKTIDINDWDCNYSTSSYDASFNSVSLNKDSLAIVNTIISKYKK